MQYQLNFDNLALNSENVPFSTQTILKAAEAMGITWEEIPGTKVFKLSKNGQTTYFRDQIPAGTSSLGFYACLNKQATKGFLRKTGVSVAKGFYLSASEPRENWKKPFDALTKPLVVKPSHGAHGAQVYPNLATSEEYQTAVEKVLTSSHDPETGVIVEEMFMGKEYRILATPDKVIGIINRVPANVIGDGQSSIEELIQQKNSDPRRGDGYEKALLKIKIDQSLEEFLAKQSLHLTDVPAAEQQIFLRPTSNLSTGGDSIDVTDSAHSTVTALALQAINAIPGLAFAGIDFMTTDISQPQTASSYIILEINSSPMLTMHDYPYVGKNRGAAQAFLQTMFT